MYRNVLLWMCLILLPAGVAMAGDNGHAAKDAQANKANQETKPEGDKQLSGMSIVGNDEAPKALYIVPWKSSDIGARTGLNMTLDASEAPVDRDVFKRQLDFYEQSTKK